MKRTFLVCSAALAVLGFTMLIGAPKAQPHPSPAPAAMAAPTAAPAAVAAPAPEPQERHPEIRAAIRNLEEAKGHLEAGAHDFGGHRVKALEHTNKALEECREALKFDR
ncbi:MAG: hypothetical protein ABSA41_00335 [Terriglobia bacterium]|jgi:uncharacterized membrane protein YccC